LRKPGSSSTTNMTFLRRSTTILLR